MKESSRAQKCTTGAARGPREAASRASRASRGQGRSGGAALLAAQMDVQLARTRFDGGQLHAAAAEVEHDVQLPARMLTGTDLQQLRGSHGDARGRVWPVDAGDAEHLAHRRAADPRVRVGLAGELAVAPHTHPRARTRWPPREL